MHDALFKVIITKDGQEDRPLAATFVDMLQSSVGASARERQKHSIASQLPGGGGGDFNAADEGMPAAWGFLVPAPGSFGGQVMRSYLRM